MNSSELARPWAGKEMSLFRLGREMTERNSVKVQVEIIKKEGENNTHMNE